MTSRAARKLQTRPEAPAGRGTAHGARRGRRVTKSRDETPEQVAARREEAAIDHALVKRAQTGDEDAFARLVDRHQRRAYRVARNLVPTDEDAQDLAQEAFLRVFRSLERFDFGHDFTTWLYRIVTNLCIDFLRKRRSSYSVSQGIDEDDGPMELEDENQAAPSDHAEAMETAAEVDAVLGTLAPHFQSVLTLRELEGLSCPEIAEIVGATHVTVRWRLHRGRKLFQEEWERRARMREKGAGNLLGENEGAKDVLTSDGGRRRGEKGNH